MKSPTRLVLLLWLASLLSLRGQTEIGYIEKFALAPDREAVLKDLIPGSEDYYFFHALHYQNSGQKEKLEGILKQWATRFPSSERRKVIENRAAIMRYDTDPEATLAYLKQHLNLTFNDEQEARNRKPDLPDTLDQARIDRGVYEGRVLQRPSLSGMSADAMERLVRKNIALQPSQRRVVLQSVIWPDTPGLLQLVIDDLKSRESRGFGEFRIHANLLPEQLAEVARQVPAVKENAAFVDASLRKLAPNPDIDIRTDRAACAAWLERLWNYASSLSPSFNSLKAAILYQRLQFDREEGIYDKARFVEYLKLPRTMLYANPRWAENRSSQNGLVDFNATFDGVSGLEKISDDTSLVRDYLLQILKDEPAWEPWAVWLEESWLKPIFAEAKIVNGVGNPEQWASLLSATEFQALRDRVDVDFAPFNREFSSPEEDVKIDVFVKNAPKILVKIYEINALNYYLASKEEPGTDLSLDGLVANREEVREIEAGNPFKRERQTFEFPDLKGKRGIWAIEFIGQGKSSRALIRKGKWTLHQTAGPAGDLLTVLDERKEPVRDSVAYFEGRRFEADSKSGKILIPYAKSPAEKKIVLASPKGEFAALAEFEHHAENYDLSAQFHIEREQLLENREATLAVRAALLANRQQIPIELLEDTLLTLVVTTLDGVTTTQEVRSPVLDSRKVFTHTFRVPNRAASVTATLSGKVEKLTEGGNKMDLRASNSIALNGIDRTPVTYDTRLSRFNEDYIFELLGKNGEPIADQSVQISIYCRGFEHPENFVLRTNEQGRVKLGPLRDIAKVSAQASNQRRGVWHLETYAHTNLRMIHASAEESITIPWKGAVENLSLMERRDGTFVNTVRGGISSEGGMITIEKLPPGDYSLLARGDHGMEVELRVTSGKLREGWYVGGARELQSNGEKPVQVVSVASEAGSIAIKVANSNASTRVHVAASRFLPISYGSGARSLFESLGAFDVPYPGYAAFSAWPNIYSSVRQIGDEYRYILERRQAGKLPGNMLTRPGLLLNPWDVEGADKQEIAEGSMRQDHLSAGKNYSQFSAGSPPSDHRYPVDPVGSNLDFLAEASTAIYNLTPDVEGIVRVPLASLKDRQYIQVYAEDSNSAAWQTLALTEVPTKFRDLRLAQSLDPALPFVQKKEITPVAAGNSLKVNDVSSSDLETYGTLAEVYRLFTALNPTENLAKFEWILRWPELDEKERAARYSEFSCHELNLFLSRKDKAFFEKAILPYLKNKKEKTFVDHYLIGDDLSGYLRPYEFSRLNIAEKCLLARAIPPEKPNTERYIKELWELLPPDPALEDRLFETALRGGDLAQGKDKSNFRAAKEAVVAEAAMEETAKLTASAAPKPAADFGLVGGDDAGARASVAQPKRQQAERRSKAENDIEYAAQAAEGQKQRKEVRPFYRAVGPTKVWAENNYYKLPSGQQTGELIRLNKFWRDYAAWDGAGLFLSPNISEASGSFAEMMLALAILDLPFKAEPVKGTSEGSSYTISANTPLIAFLEKISPAQLSKDPGGLLVSQNFFEQFHRYREEGNERFDRFVTNEFLVGIVYGANVVITNPGSSPRKVETLLQIPQGSLPVFGSKATNSVRVDLQAYSTQKLEYFFYFPARAKDGGKFTHYPVQVAKGNEVIGSAKPFEFNVVEVLSEVDKTSWQYLSQYGTDEEVFAFLEKTNLQRINLQQVAWRSRKSQDFFRKLIAFMEQHHQYNDPIYRYGVYYKDQPVITQWLQRQDAFVQKLGPWLSTKLLTVDPIQRREYEQLEYWPLINQRALPYGGENRIANPKILQQYQDLLEILSYKPSLDAMDSLSVVYYLFLQDRAAEALDRLSTVKAESAPTQLQLDYFRCYAAFYENKPEEARKIAAWHQNYPVKRWRDKFAEVLAQADEIEGKQAVRAGGPDAGRETQQEELASTEPSFEFTTKARAIALSWNNLKEVSVQYYLLDPEFSFSANPFGAKDSSQAPIVKPNQSKVQALAEQKGTMEIPIPAELANANLLIEITGAGERKTEDYHANSMRISLAENYGIAEIRDQSSGKPLSTVYVKVYARLLNGEIRFYKDGYTDLRGKFDYASVNTGMQSPPVRPVKTPGGLDHPTLTSDEVSEIDKLSLLILSESNGAEIREVAPPSE